MATAVMKENHNIDHLVLTCTLCNEKMEKPKLLPCQHSFCSQCLVKHYGEVDEGRAFCCPTCHREIELKDDDVNSLPANYLHGMVQEADGTALTSNYRCIPCSQGNEVSNASHKCLDCGDTLCDHCSKWHCRFTATRHHIVVTLSDFRDGKLQDEFSRRKILHCELHSSDEHKVPLSSYCDKCMCLVCITCMQGDHNGHGITNIHTVRENQQRLCDGNVIKLQRSEKDQDDRIGNIEKAITNTKQKADQQETEIYNIATELYAMVDKIKNSKLIELKSHYEKELHNLNEILEKEKQKQSSLQATVAFTKMFLEKCSDSDFLSHEDDIKARMESSQKEPSKGYERKHVIIEKEYTEAIMKAMENVFGNIKTQTENIIYKFKEG